MYISRKSLATFALTLFTLFASGLSHAALISYTITGSVIVAGSGLTTSSVVTATGIYDDSPLDGAGNGTILFNNGSGNTLSIDLGGIITLTESDDFRYSVSNGANFAFDDSAFSTIGGAAGLAGVDFLSTGSTPPFGSIGLFFDDTNTMFGSWDTATFTVVPVPAAMWLFGSGLIGLAGVARRNKVSA